VVVGLARTRHLRGPAPEQMQVVPRAARRSPRSLSTGLGTCQGPGRRRSGGPGVRRGGDGRRAAVLVRGAGYHSGGARGRADRVPRGAGGATPITWRGGWDSGASTAGAAPRGRVRAEGGARAGLVRWLGDYREARLGRRGGKGGRVSRPGAGAPRPSVATFAPQKCARGHPASTKLREPRSRGGAAKAEARDGNRLTLWRLGAVEMAFCDFFRLLELRGKLR